ncbi:hypothetical protein DKG71_22220 [Streptomyces sp. NEAU-S7GS2]|nr:hypothetical protein DKG71_22220 [Streptomyces sp. NEAU-S7GS2]
MTAPTTAISATADTTSRVRRDQRRRGAGVGPAGVAAGVGVVTGAGEVTGVEEVMGVGEVVGPGEGAVDGGVGSAFRDRPCSGCGDLPCSGGPGCFGCSGCSGGPGRSGCSGCSGCSADAGEFPLTARYPPGLIR